MHERLNLSRVAPSIALSFTFAALAGCAQAPRSDTPAVRVDAASADAAIAPYVGKEVPGMVVAVGYHGRLLFEKAYGKADLRSGVLMTPRTHLEIGSMTKEMTSAVLLTLAHDGRLSIDNHVNVLLPQYKYGNRMTLREVSTMSSGLQGAAANGDAIFGIVNPDTRFTPAEIYKRLNGTPPIHPPNTIFDYANIGYWLLGRTIEAATKTPYAKVMQQRIFGPLRMQSAYIRTVDTHDPKLATGYTRFGDGSFHICPQLDITSSDAAGMGVMTASDMIVWDEAIRAQRVVAGTLAKDMFTIGRGAMPKGAPEGIGYAMGWFVSRDGVHFHGGDTQLASSWNAMFPDGVDVVMLTNAAMSRFTIGRGALAYEVHNAVGGVAPLPIPKIEHPGFNLTGCPN